MPLFLLESVTYVWFWFQALCWPSCSKVLNSWFTGDQRNSVFGLIGTSAFAGGVMGTTLAVGFKYFYIIFVNNLLYYLLWQNWMKTYCCLFFRYFCNPILVGEVFLFFHHWLWYVYNDYLKSHLWSSFSQFCDHHLFNPILKLNVKHVFPH